MMKRSVAIIGAGPIGIEAALRAREDGHPVTVFERGEVAENIRSWSHVRMFSPWSINTSERAWAALANLKGQEVPDRAGFPTGGELIAQFLLPLARSPLLSESIRPDSEVLAIAREGLLKSELIGDASRANHPFRLLIRSNGRESIEHFDIVLDCSGTLHCPNALGSGGIPAPGELDARTEGRLSSSLPVLSAETDATRSTWTRFLLVGRGHSAATTAIALREMLDRRPDVQVTWALRTDRDLPFDDRENDPLPERQRVEERANAIVREHHSQFQILRGVHIDGIQPNPKELIVQFRNQRGVTSQHGFDRIYSHVGSHPDDRLSGELQFHSCYATRGPMKLAAALLGSRTTDCLQQVSHGAESLMNPEPDFFVLGSKSYGTAPNFLIRIGLQQIEDVFDTLSPPECGAKDES